MRTKLALLAAVVLGFLAAIGVRHYVEQKRQELEGGARRVAIAVARETINRGDILREHMVKPEDVEERAVGQMHILYHQRGRWLGQPLGQKVNAGQPLFTHYFLSSTAGAAGASAASKLEPGWRAITVAADQISGVAGLIAPGSRVDILGTFRLQSRGQETAGSVVTKVIARNVEVLAVDNRTDASSPLRTGGPGGPQLDRGYSSVTVHVTALEASLLTFAQAAGKLTFALRRTDDVQAKETIPPIGLTELDDIIATAARQREQLTQQPPKPGMATPP